MVVVGRKSDFARGVGGGRKSWVISDLTAVWNQHQAIVSNDPNDLERHYACGLALQMSGQDCTDEYLLFCKKAEKYHITTKEACKYYQGIIDGMEAEGQREDEVWTKRTVDKR